MWMTVHTPSRDFRANVCKQACILCEWGANASTQVFGPRGWKRSDLAIWITLASSSWPRRWLAPLFGCELSLAAMVTIWCKTNFIYGNYHWCNWRFQPKDSAGVSRLIRINQMSKEVDRQINTWEIKDWFLSDFKLSGNSDCPHSD